MRIIYCPAVLLKRFRTKEYEVALKRRKEEDADIEQVISVVREK